MLMYTFICMQYDREYENENKHKPEYVHEHEHEQVQQHVLHAPKEWSRILIIY
jgi:hypothetical protein